MAFLEFILLLLIAGISGSIGQSLVGYSKKGCLLSIVVGFIGALLGSWLSRQLEVDEILMIKIGTVDFPVLWAVIGAALFTAVLSLLSSRKK
jgi:uncharacterized membrane protein YeaQ/YmgE (transglycosylase-associated protein family)